MVKYSLGVVRTAKMGIGVKKLASSCQAEIAKADIVSKATIISDLTPTMSLMKSMPGHVTNLVTSGDQLIELAVSQGIDTKKAQKNLKEAAGFKF